MNIHRLRPKRLNRIRTKDGWWKVAFTFEETNAVAETRVPARSSLNAMKIGRKRLAIPSNAIGSWSVKRD